MSVLALAAGCSDTVELDTPPVSAADAKACRALLDALPDRVADEERREVEPGEGYGAAWGNPAIELRCGVPTPKGFDRFSGCQDADGVGWFIPESQQTGEPVAVTMTTIGRTLNVEVSIPEEYFPPVETMVDLAPSLKQAIREVTPCV